MTGGKGTGLVSTGARRGIAIALGLMLLTAWGPLAAASSEAIFPDVAGHWAERAIVKMTLKGVVRGYDDGTFQPNATVTRLQTIVMLIRALDLEAEALTQTSIPSGFANPEFIPDWARGHVALAVNRGIITGPDLTNFRGSDPATRLEVATFIVRMLGRGTEADQRAGATLPFADAASIPSAFRGYAAIVHDEGLIQGNPDGTFQPLAAITRAALVTILCRVDDTIPGILETREVSGTLAAVTLGATRTVGIRKNGTVTTHPVLDTVRVYYRENPVSLSGLIVGDDIVAILDGQGRIAFIDTSPATHKIRGTVTSLSGPPVNSVTVRRDDGLSETVHITSSTRIRLDGRTVDQGALVVGAVVTVTAAGGTVTLIEATVPTADLVGVVVGHMPSPPILTVRIGAENRTFQVAAGATITKDGVATTLSGLQSGDGVQLRVQGDVALTIVAQTMDRDLAGTLETVTLANPPTVTINIPGGIATYPVSSSAVITRQGQTATLTALRRGDTVNAQIRGGQITRLEATVVVRTISGTIEAVYIAAVPTVTVKTLAGDTETYPVTSTALIRQGRTRITLSQLQPGYLIELRVESGEAVRIDVEAVELLVDIKGTIEYIVDAAGVIVITPEGIAGTGTTHTREIHVDSKTIYIRANKLASMEDLEVGDRVLVVGSQATGIFKATAIIVMTIGF